MLLSPRTSLRTFCPRSTTSLTISALFSSDSKLLSVIVFASFLGIGGGRSSGFALIYDSLDDVKKFEARYRLARVGNYMKPFRA